MKGKEGGWGLRMLFFPLAPHKRKSKKKKRVGGGRKRVGYVVGVMSLRWDVLNRFDGWRYEILSGLWCFVFFWCHSWFMRKKSDLVQRDIDNSWYDEEARIGKNYSANIASSSSFPRPPTHLSFHFSFCFLRASLLYRLLHTGYYCNVLQHGAMGP